MVEIDPFFYSRSPLYFLNYSSSDLRARGSPAGAAPVGSGAGSTSLPISGCDSGPPSEEARFIDRLNQLIAFLTGSIPSSLKNTPLGEGL